MTPESSLSEAAAGDPAATTTTTSTAPTTRPESAQPDIGADLGSFLGGLTERAAAQQASAFEAQPSALDFGMLGEATERAPGAPTAKPGAQLPEFGFGAGSPEWLQGPPGMSPGLSPGPMSSPGLAEVIGVAGTTAGPSLSPMPLGAAPQIPGLGVGMGMSGPSPSSGFGPARVDGAGATDMSGSSSSRTPSWLPGAVSAPSTTGAGGVGAPRPAGQEPTPAAWGAQIPGTGSWTPYGGVGVPSWSPRDPPGVITGLNNAMSGAPWNANAQAAAAGGAPSWNPAGAAGGGAPSWNPPGAAGGGAPSWNPPGAAGGGAPSWNPSGGGAPSWNPPGAVAAGGAPSWNPPGAVAAGGAPSWNPPGAAGGGAPPWSAQGAAPSTSTAGAAAPWSPGAGVSAPLALDGVGAWNPAAPEQREAPGSRHPAAEMGTDAPLQLSTGGTPWPKLEASPPGPPPSPEAAGSFDTLSGVVRSLEASVQQEADRALTASDIANLISNDVHEAPTRGSHASEAQGGSAEPAAGRGFGTREIELDGSGSTTEAPWAPSTREPGDAPSWSPSNTNQPSWAAPEAGPAWGTTSTTQGGGFWSPGGVEPSQSGQWSPPPAASRAPQWSPPPPPSQSGQWSPSPEPQAPSWTPGQAPGGAPSWTPQAQEPQQPSAWNLGGNEVDLASSQEEPLALATDAPAVSSTGGARLARVGVQRVPASAIGTSVNDAKTRVAKPASVEPAAEMPASWRVVQPALVALIVLLLSAGALAFQEQGELSRIGTGTVLELFGIRSTNLADHALKRVEALETHVTEYRTAQGGPILVVSGKAANRGPEDLRGVQAVVYVLNGSQVVDQRRSWVGVTIEEDALVKATSDVDLAASVQAAVAATQPSPPNLVLGARKTLDFMVVFAKPPAELSSRRFRVEFEKVEEAAASREP